MCAPMSPPTLRAQELPRLSASPSRKLILPTFGEAASSADTWTILDRVGGDVPTADGRHGALTLGSDAPALPKRCGQERRDPPGTADHNRGRELFLRLDRVRGVCFRGRRRISVN